MSLSKLPDATLQELAELMSMMSPEFLTCDGELSEEVALARGAACQTRMAIIRAQHGLMERDSDVGGVYDEIMRRRETGALSAPGQPDPGRRRPRFS